MYVNLSYGRGFRGLIEYQLKSKGEGQHRIIGGNVRGSVDQIKEQFYSVAAQNPKVAKPVAHVIAAWHPDDQVDDQTMEAVGERLVRVLGVEGDSHQYLMVRHLDEPQHHMHIVINRVGIEGATLQNKRMPYLRLREEGHRIDAEYGFTPAVPLEERERLRTAGLEPRPGRVIPDSIPSVDEPLGGRQELRLKRMEERSGVRSAKHQVYTAVAAALDRCDGTWGSLDYECRAQGIAPSWSFNRQGGFNGASFTLLSSTRPEEAEVGPHGGTYTFKGSQLGPNGGLSRDRLQRALDRRLRAMAHRHQTQARQRERQVLSVARALRTTTEKGRHIIGGHLGRRLRFPGAYRTPMAQRQVQALLGLFDERRLKGVVPRPSVRPTFRPKR